MSKLKGVTLTVNYPDGECEAAISQDMVVEDISRLLQKLIDTKPKATSFVFVATIDREVNDDQ